MIAESQIQLLSRLRRHAADSPDSLAVREIASGRSLTYGQLEKESDRLAAMIRSALRPRGVAMLRCWGGVNFHVAFLGALLAEVSVFPVPADIAPMEYEGLKLKSGAGIEIDDRLGIRALSNTGEARWGESSLLLQSSGTTGLPKIVRRSVASVDACAANMVEALAVQKNDQVLACVPLCHSYGIEHGLLAPLFAGASVHLAKGFDLPTVQRELSGSGITVFPAVPSIYEMLAQWPESAGGLRRLRLAYSAGGPLPSSIHERISGNCGLRIAQLYGATELGSITFTLPDDPGFDPASVGRAMRGVSLRIDPDGQLLARAPSMMSEYVGEDSPLVDDGFFPTGDLGHADSHGNLFIDGRLKLLIDIGGLKVNPAEVERAIGEHPEVGECIIVPMRISETISRIKAIITPREPDSPPSPQSLRMHARQRLSPHKVPRVFEIRSSLPRSAAGKVLRHLLVESA